MEPEEILEICLKEIASGRKTAQECLAAFPNTPGLEAQLRLVTTLRTWSPTLRPEASRAIEARLRAAVRAAPRRPRARQPVRRPQLAFAFRWAVAFVFVAAILYAGGTGAVAASYDSLPGDLLYPVKRASESVQVFFTPASRQASLHATLAQRRLDEIQALAEQGVVDSALLADLSAETQAALAAVENAPPESQTQVLNLIAEMTGRQQSVLMEVMASAPNEDKPGLQRAIEASQKHGDDAQNRSEQTSAGQPTPGAPAASTPPGQANGEETPAAVSSEVPPGQAKKTDEASTEAASTPVPSSAEATPTPEVPPGQARKTEEPTTAPASTEISPTGVPETTPEPTKEPKPTKEPQPTEETGATSAPEATPEPKPTKEGGGQPPEASPESGEGEATPCPVNPAGQPVCRP